MRIEKDRAILLDDCFRSSKTSPLFFRFLPKLKEGILSQASIQKATIDGKDLYLFDDLFSDGGELRSFTETASFSRKSFGSREGIESGERPALSMNSRERWDFFSKPPLLVREFFHLLSHWAELLDAEIATLPWELHDGQVGSPSVIANLVEEVSVESMERGKHQDYCPEDGISFGIPMLFSEKGALHERCFSNGAVGKPWLISAMIYSTKEGFLPEYGMGTAFYRGNGELAVRSNCLDRRLVLFEGDLFHSIEASTIPQGVASWRASYVFKLSMNPKNPEVSLKQKFSELHQVDLARLCKSARI